MTAAEMVMPVRAVHGGDAGYDLSVPRAPAPDQPAHRAEPAPSQARMPPVLLGVLAALVWLIGYAAGAILLPLWRAGAWVCTVIALGWEDARDDWSSTTRRSDP